MIKIISDPVKLAACLVVVTIIFFAIAISLFGPPTI